MGTELTAKEPAPEFTLLDQFGEETSLREERGKVVALTFLYTNCPDICPLTAHSLGKAHEALGEDAARISIIAISVDPKPGILRSKFTPIQNSGTCWTSGLF